MLKFLNCLLPGHYCKRCLYCYILVRGRRSIWKFSKWSFTIKGFLHYRMTVLMRYLQLQFLQGLCVWLFFNRNSEVLISLVQQLFGPDLWHVWGE